MAPDYLAERDRSYGVRRGINGDTCHDVSGRWAATLRRDLVNIGLAGTQVVLLSTSNAGDRGIEGCVRLADGSLKSCSLGALDVAR